MKSKYSPKNRNKSELLVRDLCGLIVSNYAPHSAQITQERLLLGYLEGFLGSLAIESPAAAKLIKERCVFLREKL